MSTKIYKEAIDEANDLIRMAEENAKKKLVEAFAPRIRAMVEKSLFESAEETAGKDNIDDLLLSMDDDRGEGLEDEGQAMEMPSQSFSPPPAAAPRSAGINLQIPDEVRSVTLNLKEESSIDLNNESLETLLRIVDGKPTVLDRSKALRLELKMLGRALNALNESSAPRGAAIQIVEEFNAILRKSIGLKQELQESNSDLSESARIEFSNLLKEIEHMSTRTLLRNLLRESNDFNLYEAEEEENEMEMHEADEEEEDAEDAEAEEVEEEMPAEGDPAGQLSDIIAQLQGLVDDLGAAAPAGEEEVPAEEEQEPQEEGDMYGEMYHNEEEQEEGGEMHEGEIVYEIDESTIARALMEARSRRDRKSKIHAESDTARHFGGGSMAKDVKVNALSEREKNGKKKPVKPENAVKGMKKAAETGHMKEARYNRASDARLNEAVQAAASLRRQLDEQKLFNAKLLYVNKLLNNRSLSEKQLKSVVEAIDSAKTIREAKLLYTSLSESLVSTGGRLVEGARSAGGSSRPVRTSQRLDESAGEVNRWAVLAGIVD